MEGEEGKLMEMKYRQMMQLLKEYVGEIKGGEELLEL